MMRTYFTEEADDIQMDVQVGPKEEIETEVGDDANDVNVVDAVKRNPDFVAVAAVEKEECEDGECKYEFYVDAKDVAKYADLTEKTMLEALNDIIRVNEAEGMRADNLVAVITEETMGYARNLERNGVALKFVRENEDETEEKDINIDVQVGPDGEETVSEDPQEANPVDAVKRDYNNVIVAKQGDEFFVDVEDVQKSAEINHESVIDALNHIIDLNEGVNADNLIIITHENTSKDITDSLERVEANF